MDQALPQTSPRHDVIVIGGSAGALQPLQTILEALPADLPAAILVVMHVGATSHLTEVLKRASALPVVRTVSGEPVPFGQVRVAPPGFHLLVHDNHLLLRRGPRENLARPAIDPLLRSAACSFGSRVIGLVLGGALNDGTAGLIAVKRCGGIAVVQHPTDAAVPDMPLSAMRHVEVDHVVPTDGIAPLLVRLVHRPAGPSPPAPFKLRLESAIASQEPTHMNVNEKLGQLSPFTCPECHGALWEIDDGSLLRYRCHVGHAFTAEAMSEAQTRHAEELLATLLRMHSERAALALRMSRRERNNGRPELAIQLEKRGRDYEEDANVIRGILHRAEQGDSIELPSRETA